MFHLNKILRNYFEKTWLVPIKFECFSGKNLKCFVTDCKGGNQSKTAVLQFSCHILSFLFFSLKNEVFEIKILPPELQELEFATPSSRPQLSRRDYLNYDLKVTKIAGDNPDTLEFGRIKFRLKFCPKLFHTKTFCEYRKSCK